MTTQAFTYPTEEDLSAILSAQLESFGITKKPIRIKSREKDEIGWNHSEVVRCRSANGSNIPVFCKYSSQVDPSRQKYGHRGGVRYEAAVYRDLLPHAHLPVPKLFGVHEDAANDRLWLFVEYLQHGKRVSRTRNYHKTMLSAAEWCGRFHTVNETIPSSVSAPFLNYNADYFKGWARRTLAFAANRDRHLPWLNQACQGFEDLIEDLNSSPRTLIHGEYYPANILVSQGTIYPIDWESAAFGPGEIDLATLMDGWPAEMAHACQQAYKKARWPSMELPHDFERTLGAARIYVHLRWLGDRPEWTKHPRISYRFDALREAAEAMGLI